MSDRAWVKKLRKLHDGSFEIEGGWEKHVEELNRRYGLSGRDALETAPLPHLSPMWLAGNVEAIVPQNWVLAFSLNPKRDTDVAWYRAREPWTRDGWWEAQLQWLEHGWNMTFHPPLARLAALLLGHPPETLQPRIFASEHLIFMELCPYASDDWRMDPDTLQELCRSDIGFATEEEMVRIMTGEAEPALILVNGISAVESFEWVYGGQMEWAEKPYPSEDEPGKMLRHWEGTFTDDGKKTPLFGFPFLRSIAGHNSGVEQAQLASKLAMAIQSRGGQWGTRALPTDATEPQSALGEAEALFRGAGLSVPPVPEKFGSRLRRIDEWCYATRRVEPFEMYFWHKELVDVITQPRRDYVAFSHAGHGVNSYAITYELVLNGLVIFIQVAWGGVYMSAELQSQQLAERFDRCRRFLADADGRTRGRTRLLVADSEMRRVRVAEWIPDGLSRGEVADWLQHHETEHDPFDKAEELVAGRARF